MADDRIKILAPPKAAHRLGTDLTRRRLLSMGAAGLAGLVVGPGLLAACGGDDSGSSAGGTGGGGSAVAATTRSTSSRGPSTTRKSCSTSFGNVTVTVFNSNEEAIAKLQAAGGTSGFDLIIPTGAYIPQMAADGLIDTARQVEARELRQPRPDLPRAGLGPRQLVHGPEGLGLDRAGSTTTPYHDADRDLDRLPRRRDRLGERAGLGARHRSERHGPLLLGQRHRLDDDDPKDLDACEDYIVNTLAPHLKAFDSYPGINLTSGNYVLSQVWNGDARQGLLAVDDPDKYTWGLGAPTTELWMDNYVIVKDAPQPRLRLRVHRLHARSRRTR